MDTARLWLCALLILAPPGAYTVGVIIYTAKRRARTRRGRPTVADIATRIAADNQEQTARTLQRDETEPPLPSGWHWPDRERE
ncbi:hypothetical protein SAMN04489732_120102 [Amycolatopsis saalfeldensis]|uniref:Uncharacterized protein n=1 Tax=Amycolatopsis saalfeldensis TaxID=394193 RepID=A0A1H8YJX0_9PSEU|nr:hypothetical protein SAMN04489732_120102 [Amycolatopsis saalfeldensis]